jgi:hypothetical protein
VTTVGSINAGSVQADGPAGTLGAVWFVVVAPSWLPPGPPADGALADGSTGVKVADPDVAFEVDPDVDPEALAVGRVVDRLTGLGQTFTRTHFLPRRRRTTLHFDFGFGFTLPRAGWPLPFRICTPSAVDAMARHATTPATSARSVNRPGAARRTLV